MTQYINEIIRTNYKCNIMCKFCNVSHTNDYGNKDITEGDVINNIFKIYNKYDKDQLKRIILSFSGGEPLLNNNIKKYIKIAKKIGIGNIEIQTNGIILFKNKKMINQLSKAGLDELFIAQHSHKTKINKKLGTYFNKKEISNRIKYIKQNKKEKNNKLASIHFNIVLTKINLPHTLDFLKYLKKIGFIDLIEKRCHLNKESNIKKTTRKISMGFVQANGYAWKNRDELLLSFNKEQQLHIDNIINFCEKNKLLPDIHFVGPPLCLLFYPKYNLEHKRLKKIMEDKKKNKTNKENLKSFKKLLKEKKKIQECKKCKYKECCLGLNKGWINYFGKKYAKKRIKKFIKNN